MRLFSPSVLLGPAAALVLGAAGCDPVHSCKTGCANGEYCEATTQLCVANGAPKITFNLPELNQTYSGSTIKVVGNVADEEPIPSKSIEVRLEEGSWTRLTLSDEGIFAADLPLPAADGRQVQIEAQAVDAHGVLGTGARSPMVDNVGPSVSIAPVSDSILADSVAVVTFSERVTQVPEGLISLTDGVLPVKLQWNSEQTQLVSVPLTNDARYQLELSEGAVVDGAGNRSGARVASGFRVAPAAPKSSPLDLGGQVNDFDAWSDGGGHVAIAARVTPSSGPDQLVFARFDPKSGTLAMLDTIPNFSSGSTFRVSQGAHSSGGGNVVEVAGVSYTIGTTSNGRIKRDELAVSVQGSSLLSVPFPAGCGEGADAPGESAFVIEKSPGQIVVRRGTTDRSLPAGFVPRWVTGRSANDYQLLGISGTNLQAVSHTCACSPSSGSCSDAATPVTVASSPASTDVTAATTETGIRLYAFQDPNGVSYHAQCSSCPSCYTDYLFPVATASQGVGSKVLFARKQATSIELLSRDLSLNNDCSDEGTILGTVPNVAGAKKFRPLLAGSKPAVIYLNSATLSIAVF